MSPRSRKASAPTSPVPPLGFEPAASLVAGVSALFSFDAEPLTQLVSKLPFGPTTVPSRIGFSAEIAASRPQTNASQQAYLESFEGEGGLAVSLADPQWYFSSQPALGTRIPARFGATVFDLSRATTLAWQSNGVDIDGRAVRYRIDQIDSLVSQTGTGIAGPEQLLWLTLYPLSVGGQLDDQSEQFSLDGSESARRPALAIRSHRPRPERRGHIARREPRVLGADSDHQHECKPDARIRLRRHLGELGCVRTRHSLHSDWRDPGVARHDVSRQDDPGIGHARQRAGSVLARIQRRHQRQGAAG